MTKRHIVVCGPVPSPVPGAQTMTCMHCADAISVSPVSFPMVLSGCLLICVMCALRKSVKDRDPIDVVILPEQVAEVRAALGPSAGMDDLRATADSMERLSKALIAGDVEAVAREMRRK